MKRHRRLLAALVLIAIAIPIIGQAATEPYVSGGTVVFKRGGEQPDVDAGVVVCDRQHQLGVGGGCLPFPTPSPNFAFLGVFDAFVQRDVAFQVCIDINGDSRCISGPEQANNPCADLVWFSHEDGGRFFNPIGPLAKTRSLADLGDDCNKEGTGWNGYVVFLCEGEHVVHSEPHQHLTTTGTIGVGTGGPFPGQYGDYCGGIKGDVIKDYVLV